MISACIIGLNEADFIALTIRSIRDVVDEIVYVDGGSTDGTQEIVEKESNGKARIFYRKWADNWGLQRQYALQQAKGDYILQIDADEVLDDDAHSLSKYIDGFYTNWDMEYVHFIQDFRHVDATEEVHVGQNRLFVNKNVQYTRRMHELAVSPDFARPCPLLITSPKIFHLGYLKGIPSVHRKLKKHQAFSKTHTPEYLLKWHLEHVGGLYPKKEYVGPYPWVIREEYGF